MFASGKTSAASTGGYQISRSLRFNDADTAYLTRTPASASNRKTWTWSAWIKRGKIDRYERYTLFASRPTANPYTLFYFSGGAQPNQYGLRFEDPSADLQTTQVFRDVSAWYHIVLAVDTTQATASNRIKMYVNGSQITVFTAASYPTQNTDMSINNTTEQCIGSNTYLASTEDFDGYMTEINFIDGQALTPSSFGETNAQTGVWTPIAYSGSYGTNGFYLNFSDNSNTTAATLGKDYSGNGNNWTPNGFLVSAGVNNDSLLDTPTPYGVDTGVGGTVRGNYCTINPLETTNATYAPTNGNLDVLNVGNFNDDYYAGTIGVSSGKWYFETTITGTWGNTQIGIHSSTGAPQTSTMYRTYVSSGNKATSDSSSTSYGNSFAPNDVIGVAYDLDSGKIWFSKNGTFQASGDPVAGTNAAFTDLSGTVVPLIVTYAQTSPGTSGHNLNFGQRPFNYTAPSGFKALCTQNLPTPTIGATTATQASQYFNPVTFSGTGTTNAITVGFAPDFAWLKSRSAASGHNLHDIIRGNSKVLYSNSTSAEDNYTNICVFNSNGVSLANTSDANANGTTNVGWFWKANGSGSSNTAGSITSTVSANTTSGFSVVTYTGNGTFGSVGHGLGVAPAMVIIKTRNNVYDWLVYHQSLGFLKTLFLNLTSAAVTATEINNTSSTTMTVQSEACTASNNYVAYCFAEVAGYSKFGSYTGNGSTDGPFVFTGFRPAYVLIKQSSDINSWFVWDSSRSSYNLASATLKPNSSDAEETSYSIDILSNGFKIRTSDSRQNTTGGTYIYMAFASNPFKYSLAR